MPTPAASSRGVRFGIFEANFSAQELRKHGTRIRLRGQSFALLQLLVEKNGEIVTREEMKAKLWPADTFVDFENGLNAAIKKLRAVLGDSPESPRYVETIPKVGYRFIAPLREPVQELRRDIAQLSKTSEPAALAEIETQIEAENSKDVLRAPQPAPSLWNSPSRLLALGGVLALLAAGLWVAAKPPATPRVLRGTALTNTARLDPYGRIQTDGARLFFLERHGSRWKLMQISASGGEVQPFSEPFANTSNTKILAVSPNGSEMLVAPFSERQQSYEIWIMPSVGGTPRRLAEITASDAVFTADGKEITYCTNEGIFLVGRDGLHPRKLLSMSGPKTALGWSPDGKLLRFQLFDEQKVTASIWEVKADGSGLRELLPGWEQQPSQWCGRWTADGRYYIFLAFNHGEGNRLWALREDQGLFSGKSVPVALSAGALAMNEPLPGRDPLHLFVLGAAPRYEFVRYDPTSKEVRGLLAGKGAAWIAESPDGKWMAYHLDGALWRSAPDGSDKRELAPTALQPALPDISPDGKTIVFRGMPEGSTVTKIYEIPAEGGAPHELISERYSVEAPTWSADGNEVVYSVLTGDAVPAGLYRFNRKTGVEQKIPASEGFWKTRWSPDGKRLAAVSEDGKRVAVFDSSSKKWTEIAKGQVISPPGWSADSQYLFYQDLLEKDEPVRRVRVKDGNVEIVQACQLLLEGDVQRCGFERATTDGGLLLRLSRGDHELYSLEVDLP